ncbi:hypothetical protein [Gandjariella thermophila]|uniref:Uncharacterized protein n=1 Tax=Gandjariella thermophila TaxID=1931992 RepID=A0A4D4IZY9_9PSEU|nr:hypothetical protein [Gandjariella thermophila]GDY28470.1 hypothetical protein GTS_01030 [Gandjariella thermophila]
MSAQHPGSDRLADLLAAAAAPARDGELAGEQAALAAFRNARSPAHQPRRRSMIETMRGRLLTAKAAAIAAVAATTVGGVALAASGSLSAEHSAPPTGHPAPESAADAPPTTTGSADARTNGPSDRPSPNPSLVGLCHAYTAGAGSDHGKALQSPAFRVLIDTAGGPDRVPGYCAGLLAGAPGADHSGGNGRPSEEPNGHHGSAPSTHPTGRPTDHPSH